MNKKGKFDNPIFIVAIILLVVFFAYKAGIFEEAEEIDDQELPSDLQTTVELSFKDALSTSDQQAGSITWYLFNGDGTYYDSDTATLGKDSVTTRVNRDYSLWAWDSSGFGYLAEKTDFNTGSDPKKPLNINLINRSGFEISDMNDPIDFNANISGTTGATEEIRILYKCNTSNAGNLPVIVLETNSTSTGVEDVMMTKADTGGGKYTGVDCPDRLSPGETAEKLYCFERDVRMYASDGIVIAYAQIKFDDTTDPGDKASITGKIIDKGVYLEAGYTDISGVKFATEDDSDSDVGAPDSATDTMNFEG